MISVRTSITTAYGKLRMSLDFCLGFCWFWSFFLSVSIFVCGVYIEKECLISFIFS